MKNSINNNNSSSSSSSEKETDSTTTDTTKSEINSLDKNRYRNYSHPGKTLREPNYVMQHAAPSMLWLLRKIQPKPYSPLLPERIAQTVYPQDYSMRPSPHVAHQALIDFYRACNGHYGICVEDVTSLQLITKQQTNNNININKNKSFGNNSSNPYSDNANNYYIHNNDNNAGDEREAKYVKYDECNVNTKSSETNISSNNNDEAKLTVSEYVKRSSKDHITSKGNKNVEGDYQNNDDNPALFSKELEQYRLQQFRRSAQHVDSSAYGKVCHYFQTKEGCRRGKYCPFLHLGKDGQPITTERNIQ